MTEAAIPQSYAARGICSERRVETEGKSRRERARKRKRVIEKERKKERERIKRCEIKARYAVNGLAGSSNNVSYESLFSTNEPSASLSRGK